MADLTFLDFIGRDLSISHESLRATLLTSLLTVWVLIGIFFYLNRYTKRGYFNLWMTAWLFYAMWLTLHLNAPSSLGLYEIRVWKQWCVGATAVFLFWGTLRFVGQRVRTAVFGLLLMFMLIWSAVGASAIDQPRLYQLPFFTLVGVVGLATSWSFLRYRRSEGFIGAGLLGFGFGLWSIYASAIPLFHGEDDLEPSVFLLGSIIQLFIAVSMIILVLEEVKATSREALEKFTTANQENQALLTRILSTEERYRSLFDQATEAIVIADAPDLRILEINRTARQLLGLTVEEPTQCRLSSFFHVSDEGKSLPKDGNAWFEKLVRQPQIGLARRQGGVITVEVDTAPIEFDGRPAYQFFLREITDRARLEQQLRQSEKLSALGQTISGVAHELNTPLTVIKGYLDLVTTRPGLDESAREDLIKVARECDRATKLVKTFLSFSREAPIKRERIELGELIERVAELQRFELVLARIDLRISVDTNATSISADRDKLHQVLGNLLTNATHVLVERDPSLPRVIKISSCRNEKTITVTVEDNGPGVPQDLENRIFEPFFTTKALGTGTGLGLSIAHRIMTEHGGRIYYKPSPLGGAAFHLEFPAEVAPSAALDETTEDDALPLPPARMASGTGYRILVLDDDKSIADMLAEMASAIGYAARTCNSPKQALELVVQENFDLIVSDFRMPEMDGREFYQELCRVRPDMAEAILYLTGDVMSDETKAFFATSGNPMLAKPFQMKALATALHTAVEKARATTRRATRV